MNREYLKLKGKLQDAKRKYPNSPENVTGIYLEIAEYLRNGISNVDEAKINYNNVLTYGKDFDVCSIDCSLAARNLAEMAIEDDDFDSAIKNIGKSLDYAYASEDPGIIQQALHQRAHICLSCDLPEKALEYAEECKDYLMKNSVEIDNLRKDGDTSCRLASLQNLMAGIYLEIGGNKKGLEVNEKAIRYAMAKNDWVLYYRCLITKLALTIGKERIQIAELMCNITTKIEPKNAEERRFKHEARCHLALEKLRHCDQGNVTSVKKLLWKCYEEIERNSENVSNDLCAAIKRALIFVYKVEQREKLANTMNVKESGKRRHAQMVIFEKIGDDATDLVMNEIALYYYQKMLKCADSLLDQKKAWCSMAEAAKDCHLYERAAEFYRQVRKKEEQLGCTADKMLETDMAIAILLAEVETRSLKERLLNFREVYAKCTSKKHKGMILPHYIKFMKAHPHICSEGELEERSRENRRLEQNSSEEQEDEPQTDEQENSSTEKDDFDLMGDAEIFMALKEEMKAINQQEKIIKGRTNKNKHGESSLHEVARSDDYQRLKELIEKKYDVNQVDHGGWTPLSEAVSAQQYPNIRLLLMHGANPNTRSTEFLVDDQENKITSIGLTPLMEACSAGNINIAKMLLLFKARASTKDDDGWTALEYLWEYRMNAKGLNEAEDGKLDKFIEFLKQKQMDEGFNPRTYNEFLDMVELKRAIAQRKRRSSSKSNRQRRSRNEEILLSDDDEDELGGHHPSTSSSKEQRNAWIDDNDSEGEQHGNGKIYANEEDEMESDEEYKNLQDYRKCINGLRKRHSTEDAEFSESPILSYHKKLSKFAGPKAKKFFFK